MSINSIALVGAGQAGAVAARTLRRRGYDGKLFLIGNELEMPYQRPPLSKEYLTDSDDDDLYLMTADWAEKNEVQILNGKAATRLRPDLGSVELHDGTNISADKVLLVTGGRPRTLERVSNHERILYLRTRDDAEQLRNALNLGTRIAIIGAGFIGAEVASSATTLGANVTLIESAPLPLFQLLGKEIGHVYADLHRRAGVVLRTGTHVESVEANSDRAVVKTDREEIEADIVLIAVGILPNDQLAVDAGLDTGNGVLVDEYCRTSNPNVYAAGDVANHFHPLFDTRMRVEHFDNANRQASAAADNIVGRQRAFNEPHWFWSDQYGANLQYVGHAGDDCVQVVRGSPQDDTFSVFYLRDGMVKAACAFNKAEDITVATELISWQMPIDVDILADSGSDLVELLEQAWTA